MKRIFMTAVAALVLTLVFSTPDIVTQIVVFVAAFALVFMVLCLVPRKKVAR